MTTTLGDYDVIIVGGGHNALVAATYAARSGRSCLVLERLDRLGGAAVSAQAFAGMPARLSRYSYLVSLFPEALIADLELDIRLASRATSSYTPYRRNGREAGLFIEHPEATATRASFAELTGAESEYEAWQAFYREVGTLASALAPTLLSPLPSGADVQGLVDDQIWCDIVNTPIGEVLDQRFTNDLVKGIVGTDALIGTFASLYDPSLVQNKCFMYHLIGNGTGEWKVPIGGMGAVSGALAKAATDAGAELRTNATVTQVTPSADGVEVRWASPDGDFGATADYVLSGVAPWVLDGLLGRTPRPKPEGAQVKVNLLLNRLPALKSGADPAVAFAGTLHLGESFDELETAFAQASEGNLPRQLPGEIYCHTLTDRSILGDLAATDTQTLTYFGLHAPPSVFDGDLTRARAAAQEAALRSIQRHLAEPLDGVIARDANGDPCIETKLPQDIEKDLAMPGGHIFHGDLQWPWTDAPGSNPAARWGVGTVDPRILVCGSGAQRGGAVSGLGGHNAASALAELG